MPICPPGKILNPKTNRCVNENGAIGKKLSPDIRPNKVSTRKSSPKSPVFPLKQKSPCPEKKILNPKTNRCVNKDGPKGKTLRNLSPNININISPKKLISKLPKTLIKKPIVLKRKPLDSVINYHLIKPVIDKECDNTIELLRITVFDYFGKDKEFIDINNLDINIVDASKYKANFRLSDENEKILLNKVLFIMEPFIHHSGVLTNPSNVDKYSKFLTTYNGKLADFQARQDGILGSKHYGFTNYSVGVNEKYTLVNLIFKELKYSSDGIDDKNLGEWITKNEKNLPKAIFIPFLLTYTNGAGHSTFVVVYPYLKVITMFDPGDKLYYFDQINKKNCTYVHYVKQFLNLNEFRPAIFLDMIHNQYQEMRFSDVAPYNNDMQYEMEHELKGEIGYSMLSSTGFCVTWSRMAMYLCMRSGIYHPRLLMGILQKYFRKNPAFMAACLAGFCLKGLYDIHSLDDKIIDKFRDLASYFEKKKEDDPFFKEKGTFLVTKEGLNKLNIKMGNLKEIYENFLKLLTLN